MTRRPAAPTHTPKVDEGRVTRATQSAAATKHSEPVTSRDVPIAVALDPHTVRPSAWANRHARAFNATDFDKLRASVALMGGNIQAIKVRPIPSVAIRPEDATARPPIRFEIVFGHRRHRACLELGLSVAAVVQSMSDQELFEEMDRENRTHQPLSPFEQGCMFKAALDGGLYASARALAAALNVDTSIVSKALSIARLPSQVVQAFASPLDIQYRWAGPLNEASRREPAALIARAEFIRGDTSRNSAVKVFQRLVAPKIPSSEISKRIGGRYGHASMEVDHRGRLAVVIDTPWGPDLPVKLESLLRQAFNEQQ